MNQTLKTAFYRIAQDLKIKGDVATLINNAFKDRHIHYLDKCEPVFAVSRLYIFASDNLMIRMKEFNKKWLDYVLTNNASKELIPYINKYGKDTVVKAVKYTLENDLWSSPTGKEALDRKSPENLKHLEILDEVVSFLNTETETPAPVEVSEEIKTEDTPAPVVEEPKQVDIISPDKARLAFQMFDEQMDTFKTSYDIIKKFLNQEFITDLWEEENDKLNEQVRQLNTKCESLEAELEATQKLLKAETEKLEASNARRKELAEKNIGAEQRIVRLEEKNGELQTEVNQLKNTPRYAKVIPLSKLSQQPLVGPKLTSLLIDFLASYDIKVDTRR